MAVTGHLTRNVHLTTAARRRTTRQPARVLRACMACSAGFVLTGSGFPSAATKASHSGSEPRNATLPSPTPRLRRRRRTRSKERNAAALGLWTVVRTEQPSAVVGAERGDEVQQRRILRVRWKRWIG